MSTPPPADRAALGRERLAARARRISLIRRRVVAATLATFVLAWGAIAWNGSMGAETATTTAQAITTTPSSGNTSSDTTSSDDTTSSSGTTSSDDATSSSGTTSSDGASSSSGAAAPLATSQS